jgi:hypothetical protein
MNPITLGTIEAHEKLTARLFYKPAGDSGYIDCGNVKDYRYSPDNQYRTRMASDKGYRFVDDEQLDSTHQKWEFTLDEEDSHNARLLRLARHDADSAQTAETNETAEITSAQLGRTYFLGVRPIYDVGVEVAAAAKTEGTDYTVDRDAGSITILPGGTIAAEATVDIAYSQRARDFQHFTGRDIVLFRGAVKFLEYNQLSKEPLREIDFDGVIRAHAWPEQTGEFGQFAVTVTATSKPAIKKRDVFTPAEGEGS